MDDSIVDDQAWTDTNMQGHNQGQIIKAELICSDQITLSKWRKSNDISQKFSHTSSIDVPTVFNHRDDFDTT